MMYQKLRAPLTATSCCIGYKCELNDSFFRMRITLAGLHSPMAMGLTSPFSFGEAMSFELDMTSCMAGNIFP